MWTVVQTPIWHIISERLQLKISDPCMQIALTHLGFWMRSAQNCRKSTFLDNLRTITQEWSMETRKMTPFFIYFFCSVCNIHFYNWKWSKFIFLWSPLWSIQIFKMPQFWAKATNSDSHHIFVESGHPEVTKNP